MSVVLVYTLFRSAFEALGMSFNALDTPREMANIVFFATFTANFIGHFNSSS